MSDKIIGIMWNKNEGDILDETITKAIPIVDHLLVADDDSSDNSWDVIRSKKSELAHISRYSETPNKKYSKSNWQRQSLLDKAVEMFGRDIWIQVIESDLIAVGTDIREQLESRNHVHGIAMWWITLEAVRKEWREEDEKFPNWDKPIQEVMPWGHILEKAPYTWRPYPDIYFGEKWSPFPRGLNKYGYLSGEWRVRRKYCKKDTPLWGHYNIRGRKHFNEKYANTPKDSKSRRKREIVAFVVPEDVPEVLFKLNREEWVRLVGIRRGWSSLW